MPWGVDGIHYSHCHRHGKKRVWSWGNVDLLYSICITRAVRGRLHLSFFDLFLWDAMQVTSMLRPCYCLCYTVDTVDSWYCICSWHDLTWPDESINSFKGSGVGPHKFNVFTCNMLSKINMELAPCFLDVTARWLILWHGQLQSSAANSNIMRCVIDPMPQYAVPMI
jgi:hypothetical protein